MNRLLECNVCGSRPAGTHHPKCVGDELQIILDCMSGADGGSAYVLLRTFLGKCAAEGNDVPFVRQLAYLIKRLAPDL